MLELYQSVGLYINGIARAKSIIIDDDHETSGFFVQIVENV